MCLGFDYASARKAAEDEAVNDALATAMEVMKKTHDVDCNNTQQYVVVLDDGSTLIMDCLSASSDSCVCYMYPVDPVCLGDGDKYLIPSDTIPCQAAMFDGIHNPEKYVPKPILVEVPVYRSLDYGGNGGETTAIPEVTLPEGVCVKNADGSVTFTLKLSKIVKTDDQIEQAIACGELSDRVQYNLAMGKACAKELLRNMAKNKVDTKNLFAMREDDPTQVDPEAMINFLDMLLPNLIPGKDIIVGVPAFDENGKSEGAAFSLWFHYPNDFEYLPLLGLVHNVDPSDQSLVHKVEGNFYIATNKNRDIYAVDESGGGHSMQLRKHDSFTPVVPNDEAPLYDYSAWIKACSIFQTKCQASIWNSLEEIVKKNGLPGFDKSTMLTTNLKDMAFPKQTMTMSRVKASHERASSEDGQSHERKRVKSPGNDMVEVM